MKYVLSTFLCLAMLMIAPAADWVSRKVDGLSFMAMLVMGMFLLAILAKKENQRQSYNQNRHGKDK